MKPADVCTKNPAAGLAMGINYTNTWNQKFMAHFNSWAQC